MHTESGAFYAAAGGGREGYESKELSALRVKRERDALLVALRASQKLFDLALPKFNWGASALDAGAIKLLNDVPVLVNDTITDVERGRL